MKKLLLSVIISCISFASFAVGSITGTFTVCVGLTTTLSCTPPGGTWTSSNPSIATIGSSSGIVSGAASGVVIITYASGVSGDAYQTVTVNPNPGPILMLSTTAGLCVGTAASASDATPGGTWSSSNPSIATIGSSSGAIMGMSAGSCTISYILPTGCYAIRGLTINPSPSPISGPSSVCVGFFITLSSSPSGGLWSSGSTTTATVGASTGIVTGMSVGTVNITYTVSGCRTSTTITVTPTPSPIAGPTALCVGGIATLTDAVPGGSWSSTTTSVATIGSSSGIITALALGTSVITYMLPSGCYTIRTESVVAAPAAITGPASVCAGSMVTLVCPGGGTWTSSSTAIATVGSSSGIVTGVATGSGTITYTLPGGCMSTASIFVSPIPTIFGVGPMCVGSALTLSASPAGAWSSGSTSVATIGSSTGVVTGIATGLCVITFTSTAGCINTATITVNAAPAAIAGPGTVCAGQIITLTDATVGGTWSSSATSIGTVGSSSGIVTGVSAGAITVTYALSAGCYVVMPVTVTPMPCVTLGINTASNTDIEIFPNPAYDELIISTGNGVYISFTITNEVGEAILQDKLTKNKTTIDISILPQGLYYINVKGDSGNKVLKFVKI